MTECRTAKTARIDGDSKLHRLPTFPRLRYGGPAESGTLPADRPPLHSASCITPGEREPRQRETNLTRYLDIAFEIHEESGRKHWRR
jgi:hypothetical protein